MSVQELITLNSQENNGRGISCVKDIITYLQSIQIEKAKLTYQHDGDKMYLYPKIQEWFYNNFGCRTHLKIGCQSELCKSLKIYNDKKL